jgi:hypothetical protein
LTAKRAVFFSRPQTNMNPSYVEHYAEKERETGVEMLKIMQKHAHDAMAEHCTLHDVYTERGLYDCIRDCYCNSMPFETQKELYPSIIHYEDSRLLTYVHKQYGHARKRTMYDTIVAGIWIKAEYIRSICVYHRHHTINDVCHCRGCADRENPQQ